MNRPAPQPSTRERLLREGLRLFASRGFEGTTVGEIEAAAGLQPRRGALYRHFPSKLALLEEAVAHHNSTTHAAVLQLTSMPAQEPAAMAMAVGRWLLADLDAQRSMTQLLEREGPRLAGVRDEFRAGSDEGFRAAAGVLRRWADTNGLDEDVDAFAVVLIGGLINFRRSEWTLGETPLALSDERFLAGFADLFSTIVRGR